MSIKTLRDIVPMEERHFVSMRGASFMCIVCRREGLTQAEAAERCDVRVEKNRATNERKSAT